MPIVYPNKLIFLLLFFVCHYPLMQASAQAESEFVTIAILAKDKAHTLPLYLSCIENQTWPASKTYLYIRTNNNNDDTVRVLRDWIERVGDRYANIYFDDTDVAEHVQQYEQHEWNYMRLKVMGIIRQKSVDWAIENNSHYFVVDCDNFIKPDTLEAMVKTNLPIVAPFLWCSQRSYYSNYHYEIDENGYYLGCSLYYDVLNQSVKGLIDVPVVHCAYFIRHDVLDKIYYDDESWRYEYVIFSDSARKQNIPQYIDNRTIYGYLTFAETKQEFAQEPFFDEFYFFEHNKEIN